ncbi:1-phosphatidylinositol 4,5-bisphosphate phosphodiesterase eta-1 [Epinephelus lanceolatus]|uniref:1-phosphatidylinositol 4,5-bisphosphate phosphodiesterase eta-1 isoform X1 n=1 Tax=Epinephelus lanceolatus TaxID=310571 RepID=UPI001446D2FF|nr:1-phosphatidylinositol 4,5-bisphosphate phosphodiesterase eta-1 isoform X1 [Epinephelus lanceolatus]XP_033487378.1 1-phosphatidylinositol 4,5-bisphosphate phosphodiesterase eta-1 isoform X1 [Epinephelus lanceolatus]
MSSWVVNRKGEPQYRRHFLTDNSTYHVERCMSVMQSGTQMVKLKAGSKGLVRLFFLDDHRSCIRWKPSRKSEKAKITIDSLYKVTEGIQSDIFHRHADGTFDPACCFTVYHGNHMESLDLVTSNAEEARTWITGLRYLMAGISDEDSLAKRQRTHDQWLKQTFEEADKNGDGLLNIEEIYQLLHKLNVNLPRRKVKQMFQEADTDDQQGTLTYEEFSVFYKMMSLRRDLFLLMMAYSDRKDHLTAEELANFLRNEQKMANVTPEYVAEIIDKFEVSDENKQRGVLGIEGFTSFMRSPTCDIFNPLHHEVNQDMDQPLCNYFIASSHNTYLTGDQLLSHSKTDMYAWVLQSGCRCVEVDCWDGPDGEPMVQHGYTLTSKIPFKSVIETINKYAFINNQYPVILSIENHCSIQQQKKIAQYLREIFGEKLDVRDALSRDSKTLPSPQNLLGKILIKGKSLPAYLSADAEEGEVSDDDSADEIEDDFKLKSSNGNGHHQVESHIRKKLDSLLKESRIGDKEDSDSFSIRALLRATSQGLQKNLRQSSKGVLKKSQSRSFITTLKQKRHSKSRLSCQSVDKEDDDQEGSGREAGGQFNRGGRKRKTMKLSRDLSNLVVFTNSVASQECLNEGTPGDVLSFSETRAQSLVNHKAEQFLAFNQRQLSRIYPSAYRIDSSNFNPQFYWNVGCQLVALNYQTEGRMMQLNRAKFMVNGGIGYVLKPPPMCKGSFNPFSDDPLPAYPKKQLILKIISGQQLPKPPDSMLGDRGEIIDPFVEVEIIGLPVDCCKEQTRVVDDNGFNPVWEETLSFTLHMAEIVLVRFLVWDHDPIGRDFIGQRTVAFSSLMPGYRHVYLEGLTEASIFVHVSVHDVYGKWSPLVLNPSFTIMHFLGSNKGHQLRGIRGLFNRSSKSSVDTNSGGLRKRSISDHLLRRTASAPAKGRKKTKMALSESVASISDQKNSTGAGAGEEGMSGKEGGVGKRYQPRGPLTHRPISMPLDRLLQGQLSLCSPDKEQNDLGSDTVIGACPFNRPRSSSLDPFIESSFSVEPNISSPSKTYINRNKETDQSDEASYLVIGGGQARKEEEYANYQPEDNEVNKSNMLPTETEKKYFVSPSKNSQMKLDKPETSSISTTFTVAPSVSSSSSSSAPSSLPPLSPVSMDCDLKSPSSLHDSTISRLIDAVSLGNEQDTCGSISALIGQFENTVEQNDSHTSPHHTPFCHSNFRPTTPKVLQDSRASLKSNTASANKKHLLSPQKVAQKTNQENKSVHQISHADLPAPALLSSPETAELEEVYTILDEEVLLPVSVYNLRKQTVHVQADTRESTPSNSLGSSPAKVAQGFGKGNNASWDDMNRKRGGSEKVEEAEESVYEEVYDPPALVPGAEQVTKSYMGSSVNNERFQFLHDSAGNAFAEVEINVDEDPLEIMMTSPRHGSQWEGLTSPTKRHAIYENHESTPSYSQQKQPLSYCDPQQQYPSRAFSQCSSPINQPSYQLPNHHQHHNNFQPSPFHRPVNSRPSIPSPLRQNSYPVPQSNSDAFNNSRDYSSSYMQQKSYSGSQILMRSHQDRLGYKQMEREQVRCFHNGFSSSESLPGQAALSTHISRDRGLYSPSSDCDAVYNHLDYDCITPPSESSAPRNTKPHCQSQTQSYTPTHSWKQKAPLMATRQQSQPESRDYLHSDLGPLSSGPQSGTIESTVPSPCKSKSLGDLTSEDILCNFQSKYNIISRSFITPHMRKQMRIGTMGEVTFQSQSCDPLTEQLRKLVSLEGDDSDRDKPQPPQLRQETKSPLSQPQATSVAPLGPRDVDDSPPPLTRRLSSRSQSRVRHINSRARERQQEALKPRAGLMINSAAGIGGVVLRSKPASQNPPANRHSTGSYIAGYLGQLEDRGLPEGACTSLRYGNGDQYGDRYYTDDSLPPADSNHSVSEPEVYFLLRL